jgi:predicted metalloendopeptidase
VNNIENIRSISSILDQALPDTIQTYTIMNFLNAQAFHLPKVLRNAGSNSQAVSPSNQRSRRVDCAVYVNKHMGFAVSKLYVDKYFNELALNEVINSMN